MRKILVVSLIVVSTFPTNLLLFIPSDLFVGEAEAATTTLTSNLDFEAGLFNGTNASETTGDIRLSADGAWGARNWRTPDITVTNGTALTSDGVYTYMIPSTEATFYRYLPDEDRWQNLARAPHTSYTGGDLTAMGNHVYAEFGGYQRSFARYSKVSESWENLTDLPDLMYNGASLANDGTYVYALRGGATTDFWRYNPSANSWTTLTGPPATISTGGDLIYDNGYLYTLRGSNTTTFYRYDIAAGTWSTMTAAPGTINDNSNKTTDGTYIYVPRGNNTNTFYRYSISGNSWTTLTNAPTTTRYVGVTYNADDGYVYFFRGNATYDWWKYDSDSNSFLGNEVLPATPQSGADVIYYSGDVYYKRSNGSNFYGYDIATNVWTTLANPPGTFAAQDTKGVRAGSLLYYFRGTGATFYSYNTANNTWSTLTDAPAAPSYGSSLAYPGSGDYIYATRGGLTSGFWRYSISGNSWDDAGVADLPTDSESGYGARIISDGTDVYAITGSGIANILKYSVSGNSWTLLNTLPFSPYWGTDIVYDGGKIYAQSGYYRKTFWEYTISTNTWRQLKDMPGYYAQDIGPYNGGSIAYDTDNDVLYSIYGAALSNFNTYTPGADNYPSSGTWTSDVIDLTYVASFTSLTASTTTPDDSAVTFETRSSSDAASWSSWQSLSGSSIQSSANRYIQVRATLSASTDLDDAPSVQSITITYTGDETAPTNPDTFTGTSQQISGSALTSGQSYSYDHPYFTWSGATDGETSVSSYYVYFGTNASADPATLGNSQTGATYVVTTPMSAGTYYLRIKTVDAIGNVSSATTGFTYVYSGVTPTSSTYTSTADFSGTASNVSILNDEIKLASKSGFWEQERLTYAPAAVNYGAGFAHVSSSNKLYTFRGNSTTFYEYDIDTDTWTTLSAAPATVYQGGDLVEGPDGYLYGMPGRSLNSFWRYDIANDTWSDGDAADAPATLYYGSSLVYDGSRYIYVLRGNSDDAYYRYDTQADTWDNLTSTDFGAPTNVDTNNVYLGGDLAYNGDSTMYAIQGNTRAGFASYDSGSNEWTQLADLPALPYNGAQIEYDSTSNAVYYVSGWIKPFFYKYDVGNSTWSQLEDAPGVIRNGATMRNVGGTLYILAGNATTFWKYNIAKATWHVPNRGFFGTEYRGTDYQPFNYGAELVKGDGNYYYMTRGNFDNQFVRYDSSSGTAVKMKGAPVGFYNGSAMTYNEDTSEIYAIGSTYEPRLFTYDIATDSWSEQEDDPLPVDPSSGSSLAYDGSQYIYWIRGTSTTFYRYDTQAVAGTRWSQMANAPGAFGYGSVIIYKGGYIYAMRGNNVASNPFYRYDPGANSWTTLSGLPIDVYNDGTLVDGGGDKIIACKGENTANCYEYSVSADSWSAIANAPAQIYTGGSAASNKSDKMYMIAGAGTNTFTNGLYSYVIQSDSSSFEESGSYTSGTHDLTSVYRFANLNVTYTSASNATLSVSTRTSEDNSDWSTWTAASSLKTLDTQYVYEIKSPANRYIQVKFELTSGDGVYSGVISDYSISYYQDSDVPTNPSTLGSYTTATQSATMTTNNWYNHSAPNFDWPDAEAEGGASDTLTGSGVSGYYVYFGTNSSADPSTDGSLQATSSYTASSLTSGETYYLRIETVDDAGNVSGSVWQPYVYKYDNVAPENPSTVTADPSGYTAVNDFDFAWSGATDSASTVSSYCYKTTLNGAETCGVTGTSITGVEAEGTGASTFYVRAVDAAGNKPSTYSSVSYYYSSTAPSAPQNLAVSPSSNTVNQFSFSWSPPAVYYGAQASLRYHYSVNALPTAQNVNAVGLTSTNLATDAYATLPGDNVFYVVAKDEAGNIDYNNYASVTFTADTSAPEYPEDLEIADISVKATESWKLAVSWETPSSTGSGVASYKVYSSTTEDAVCSDNFDDFSYVASTTGRSYVDTDIEQETHYYCVKACDSTNNCSAVSETVSLFPDGRWESAPELVASPSATVKTKSAIIEWSTSRTASSFVQYGTSSDNLDAEAGSSEQVAAHEITLPSLDPGTTYYYKVLFTDEDGNTGESDVISFTTEPAPFISNVDIIPSLYAAAVTFTVANATEVSIKYGETVSYGGAKTVTTPTSETTVTVTIDDLEEGSAYNFQIDAEDEEGNVFSSDNYAFETLPVPKITAFKMQQIAGQPSATMRLLWATNSPTSTIVTYYPGNIPNLARDSINLSLTRTHNVVLSDLLDDTQYTFVIRGKDSAGNEIVYPAQTAKTALDLRPPQIENMNVESTIIGVGDDAKAQVVVSWDTDELSTTQVEYAEGTGTAYTQTTQEDTNKTTNHTVTISGLIPERIYHLRAVSKDGSSNIGQSFDTVIVTPKSTKDALNLVIENLGKTFGFIKQK